jgi:chemotaxis protein CheZ
MNPALSAGPLQQKTQRGWAMPIRRKVFRIEEMQAAEGRTLPDDAAPFEQINQRMLDELASLRAMMERKPAAPAAPGDARSELDGLRQLKDETDTIHRAIARTKEEIAALHASGLNSPESGRASRELDAVAGGTERAIQQILAAAEDIDESANTLSAALKDEQHRALAQDIRDQVIRIFEASNFQDLAGQRIAKVLATLKFIEDRIVRMMDIWGGIDAFKPYTAAAVAARKSSTGPSPVPLHGPKLEGDAGHITQSEIDKLFES